METNTQHQEERIEVSGGIMKKEDLDTYGADRGEKRQKKSTHNIIGQIEQMDGGTKLKK